MIHGWYRPLHDSIARGIRGRVSVSLFLSREISQIALLKGWIPARVLLQSDWLARHGNGFLVGLGGESARSARRIMRHWVGIRQF